LGHATLDYGKKISKIIDEKNEPLQKNVNLTRISINNLQVHLHMCD